MTRQDLRHISWKIGKTAFLVGLPLLLAGLSLASPALTLAGAAALCIAAYSSAFSIVGAVL